MEDCPICYELMVADVNVCVTICKHKFHTNCLMMCGNVVCPICKTDVSSFPSNCQTKSSAVDMSEWIEDCKEEAEMIREIEEKTRQKEEKRKNDLKKTNIKKYNLFYSK